MDNVINEFYLLLLREMRHTKIGNKLKALVRGEGRQHEVILHHISNALFVFSDVCCHLTIDLQDPS